MCRGVAGTDRHPKFGTLSPVRLVFGYTRFSAYLNCPEPYLLSYQVLARKWRPRSFPAMVGQEHVLRALINALDQDRLHHAYLFTGTRGVGKTTIARILAKSLNCEQGISSSPCGQCSACTSIDEGRFVDLIEVDAASRTKVEDTREILDNVQYAPSRGRYKVYLIDEVHMLSNHSFNALLKTLEEPPPHVKFLLATTDPQKLPVTILSRCLQFNLKRLPLAEIRDHLTHILQTEGVEASAAAIGEIARAADGSMRDALSLLDQAIAHGGGVLETGAVRLMLGTIDRARVIALLRALAAGEPARLLDEAAALAEFSPDYTNVLNELNSALVHIALLQAVPGSLPDDVDHQQALEELAGIIRREDVQLWYQIGIGGRRDLPFAPEPRGGFEMILLRMLAFRPAGADDLKQEHRQDVPAAAARVDGGGESSVSAPAVPARQPAPAAEIRQQTLPDEADDKSPPVSRVSISAEERGKMDWAQIVVQLPLEGIARQLVMNCVLVSPLGEQIELALKGGSRVLHSTKCENEIARALAGFLGHPVRLRIHHAEQLAEATPSQLRQREEETRQAAAETAIHEDPLVQSLLRNFDGRIEPGSVQPR